MITSLLLSFGLSSALIGSLAYSLAREDRRTCLASGTDDVVAVSVETPAVQRIDYADQPQYTASNPWISPLPERAQPPELMPLQPRSKRQELSASAVDNYVKSCESAGVDFDLYQQFVESIPEGRYRPTATEFTQMREQMRAVVPDAPQSTGNQSVEGSWQPVDQVVEATGGQPVGRMPSDWEETALAFAPMTINPQDQEYELTVETLKEAAVYGASQNWVTLELLGTRKSTQAWKDAVSLYKSIQTSVSEGVI